MRTSEILVSCHDDFKSSKNTLRSEFKDHSQDENRKKFGKYSVSMRTPIVTDMSCIFFTHHERIPLVFMLNSSGICELKSVTY